MTTTIKFLNKRSLRVLKCTKHGTVQKQIISTRQTLML
jgi:hypothetical protein